MDKSENKITGLISLKSKGMLGWRLSKVPRQETDFISKDYKGLYRSLIQNWILIFGDHQN